MMGSRWELIDRWQDPPTPPFCTNIYSVDVEDMFCPKNLGEIQLGLLAKDRGQNLWEACIEPQKDALKRSSIQLFHPPLTKLCTKSDPASA